NPKSKIENPQERALIRGVASQIENRSCLLPSNDKRISSCDTRHVIYPWNQSQIENRKSSRKSIDPWGRLSNRKSKIENRKSIDSSIAKRTNDFPAEY
ncbi:hypothetical protein, partial [Microcoleus sp. B4-C1]|uniref:hypothetical protein n=1 Tax=Microcoleus sp. B4-C1 TaxID=2818660 RepID=UPI002FD64F63